MNLEMPSAAEADSLRTILLIVLGVMILTIPVICVIVVAKVTAQRKQRPAPSRTSNDAAFVGGSATGAEASHTPTSTVLQNETSRRPCDPDPSKSPDADIPKSSDGSWCDSKGSSSSDGGSSLSGGGNPGGGGGGGGD